MASSSLREPLLRPRGQEGRLAPKSAPAVPRHFGTAAAFVCFVAVRSLHPIVIDISKTDGKMPYGKATPCVINSAVDVVLGNFLSYCIGGMDGLRMCWAPGPLKVFSSIAVLYAFGDFLEMVSMNQMGGAVYQILLQSKLLITALIVWVIRRQGQTVLQWNVLLTIALGMSAFVLVDEGSSEGSAFKPIGLLFVLAKVFFSCLCAVLTEKYLKQYKDMPICAQIAQLKFSWFFVSMLLTLVFDKNVREEGFFSGWDARTGVVAVSWVCKGWTTFLVLKNLDSVLKNIGEAAAVLVIYGFDVMIAGTVSDVLPVHPKAFRLSTFLIVMVVCLTVVTYTMAPGKQSKVRPSSEDKSKV